MEQFDRIPAFTALVGRIFLSLIFILSGLGKMTGDTAETVQYMQAHGLPAFLFWPAALFEFAAGLAVLVGVVTRINAYLLAGFCLLTAILFHADFADQIQMILFMKNLTIMGGLLLLARYGAGEYSVDAWTLERGSDDD